MKGYCSLCGKEIDEVEAMPYKKLIACNDCIQEAMNHFDSPMTRLEKIGKALCGLFGIFIIIMILTLSFTGAI